jgi:hypothetical protein
VSLLQYRAQSISTRCKSPPGFTLCRPPSEFSLLKVDSRHRFLTVASAIAMQKKLATAAAVLTL